MGNRLICLCNVVDEKEIMSCLMKGASKVEEVQSLTRAGTTCGRCLPEIDSILENFQEDKQQKQKKFNF